MTEYNAWTRPLPLFETVPLKESTTSYVCNRLDESLKSRKVIDTFLAQTCITSLGQLGVKEASANKGPRVDSYAESIGRKTGSQWCAIFAHAMWNWSAKSISQILGEDVKVTTRTSAGAVSSYHRASSKTPWNKLVERLKGDPQCMNGSAFVRVRQSSHRDAAVNGSSRSGHMGIIIRYIPETEEFVTVEGNTILVGEDANGGMVAMKTISIRDPRLVGVVHPEIEVTYGN